MSRYRRFALLAGFVLSVPACGPPGDDPVDRALLDRREPEAWALSGEAIEARPGSAAAWLGRARAALRTFRTAEGVEAAARAVELAPGDWRPLLVAAELDQARFRNVAAVEAAARATELAPEEPRAHRALGLLRLGGGIVGTAAPEGAEAAFRVALARAPEDPRSRLGLAVALVLAGRHEEAVPELDALIAGEVAPPAEAFYQRGLARMRERDFEGAVADFRRAAGAEPVHHGAWFNLGRLLPRLGDPDAAKEALARGKAARELAERIHNLEISWHSNGGSGAGLQLAAAWREAGWAERAYLLARTLVEDHPSLPPAHLELAEAALATGRPEEAREAAESARALNPGNPRVSWVLARARLGAGDAQGALTALGPAARGSREPRLNAVAGRALAAAGDRRQAERLLGAALAARPREVDWLVARAELRLAAGRHGRAEDDLRVAIAADPGRAEPWALLAAALDESGRPEEAGDARARADSLRAGRRARERAEESRWRTDFLVP